MTIKRASLLFATLALALATVLSGCQGLPFKKTEAAPVVNTLEVKRGTLQVAVTSSGNITLPRITKLGFSGAISGSQAGNAVLSELNVSMGSRVKKDDVIARLDTSGQERDLVRLKNSLESAKLNLEKAKEPQYKPQDIAKAESAVVTAQSNLDYARAALEKARSPYTDNDFANADAAVNNADAAVRSAGAALEKAKNDLDTTVKQNQVNVQDATNTLTTLQNQFEGGGGGGGKGAAPTTVTEYDVQKANDALTLARRKADSDFSAGQISANKAQDTLAAAQSTYNDAVFKKNDILSKKTGDPLDIQQKQNSVTSGQVAVDNAKQSLSLMKEPPDPLDIRLREIAVDAAQLAVDDANDALTKSTITAPFDGIIGDFKAKVGDAIQPGSFFIPIVDPTQARVDAFVEEYDVNNVKLGMPVVVTLDAVRGQAFNGAVSAISPLSTVQQGVVRYAITVGIDLRGNSGQAAGRSATGQTRPQTPSTGRVPSSGAGSRASAAGGNMTELKDGLSATASIIINQKDNVVMAPNRALMFQSGQQKVQVLVNGIVEDRIVKVGLANDQFTEITDGINEGDAVVIQTAAARQSSQGPGALPMGARGLLGR